MMCQRHHKTPTARQAPPSNVPAPAAAIQNPGNLLPAALAQVAQGAAHLAPQPPPNNAPQQQPKADPPPAAPNAGQAPPPPPGGGAPAQGGFGHKRTRGMCVLTACHPYLSNKSTRYATDAQNARSRLVGLVHMLRAYTRDSSYQYSNDLLDIMGVTTRYYPIYLFPISDDCLDRYGAKVKNLSDAVKDLTINERKLMAATTSTDEPTGTSTSHIQTERRIWTIYYVVQFPVIGFRRMVI